MHHLCSPRTGISSFPSVVCQTLPLVRSLWLDLSEGTEGVSRWRGRTVAVSSTCVWEHPVASLEFKTQKDLGVFVLQRCALRGCGCWPCCLPFTCLAPSWDHLPADSCPFTRIAALWKAVPNSSCGCSSPLVLAVQLLPGGEKYRQYLTGEKIAQGLQRSFSLWGEEMTFSCNNHLLNLLNSSQPVHLNLNLIKNISLYDVLGIGWWGEVWRYMQKWLLRLTWLSYLGIFKLSYF